MKPVSRNAEANDTVQLDLRSIPLKAARDFKADQNKYLATYASYKYLTRVDKKPMSTAYDSFYNSTNFRKSYDNAISSMEPIQEQRAKSGFSWRRANSNLHGDTSSSNPYMLKLEGVQQPKVNNLIQGPRPRELKFAKMANEKRAEVVKFKMQTNLKDQRKEREQEYLNSIPMAYSHSFAKSIGGKERSQVVTASSSVKRITANQKRRHQSQGHSRI